MEPPCSEAIYLWISNVEEQQKMITLVLCQTHELIGNILLALIGKLNAGLRWIFKHASPVQFFFSEILIWKLRLSTNTYNSQAAANQYDWLLTEPQMTQSKTFTEGEGGRGLFSNLHCTECQIGKLGACETVLLWLPGARSRLWFAVPLCSLAKRVNAH